MFSSNTTQVASAAAVYIEEIFSTFLYTGTGSAITINNGINLSTNGGLVWVKPRNTVDNHYLYDTVRGVNSGLESNTTSAAANYGVVSSFNSNGYTDNYLWSSSENIVSWTFRKQPKFFDVVTFTTPSSGALVVNHSLGSTPGFIVIKDILASDNWICYHRYDNFQKYFYLNTTDAAGSGYPLSSATDTTVTVNVGVNTNANRTYVMYLYAHNAGGFGLTGTDNVISCGSFNTGSGGNANVTLGYEPQWLMFKSASATSYWYMFDNMRGWSQVGAQSLQANLANAESTFGNSTVGGRITATGFTFTNGSFSANEDWIYIAIRRGPMKVPTDATKVFAPVKQSGGGTVTTNFPVDLAVSTVGGTDKEWMDRLRGGSQTYYNYLASNLTLAEQTGTGAGFGFDNNTGYKDNGWWSGPNVIYWNFQRAPSFFDEVCYTGNGTYGAANHNLGVTPELVIYKSRSNAVNWGVIKPVSSIAYYDGLLNSNSAFTYYSNDPSVAGLYTSTQFAKYQDTSGYTYVAYLFATCAGVSKVGSYTGNGTTQTINCGFSGGARFVLIKRTDSTGDWYVYDTARGMTTLTDPYLLLNSSAAETATLGSVTTVSTGFAVNASILAAINTNGASYIYLSIA